MNSHTRVLLNLTNEGHLAIHTGMDASEAALGRKQVVLFHLCGRSQTVAVSGVENRMMAARMDEGTQGVAGLLIVWTKGVL